jgi:hypothetical protein
MGTERQIDMTKVIGEFRNFFAKIKTINPLIYYAK